MISEPETLGNLILKPATENMWETQHLIQNYIATYWLSHKVGLVLVIIGMFVLDSFMLILVMGRKDDISTQVPNTTTWLSQNFRLK